MYLIKRLRMTLVMIYACIALKKAYQGLVAMSPRRLEMIGMLAHDIESPLPGLV